MLNLFPSFYTFFEGVSEPNPVVSDPAPVEVGGNTYTYYQATQKQRQIERELRAVKREYIGGNDMKMGAIKAKEHQYARFCEKAGLKQNLSGIYVKGYKRDFEYLNVLESEESHKGIKRNLAVNIKEIESARYRNKYSRLGEEKTIERLIYTEAKSMLAHRGGTDYEDMVFINSVTGKMLKQTNASIVKQVSPTKAMKRMAIKADDYTIIAMHNHPGSSLPSWSDLSTAQKRKYKYGLCICHDGSIYKYSVKPNADIEHVDFALDNLHKALYNNDVKRIELSLKKIAQAGVKLEVL